MKSKRKKPEELDGGEKECETSETPSERRTTRSGRRGSRVSEPEASVPESPTVGTSRVGRKSTTTKESAKSHMDGQEKGATDGMFEMVMNQMHTMAMDQKEAREIDRAK